MLHTHSPINAKTEMAVHASTVKFFHVRVVNDAALVAVVVVEERVVVNAATSTVAVELLAAVISSSARLESISELLFACVLFIEQVALAQVSGTCSELSESEVRKSTELNYKYCGDTRM